MIRWLKRVWAWMNWTPTWPAPLPIGRPAGPFYTLCNVVVRDTMPEPPV